MEKSRCTRKLTMLRENVNKSRIRTQNFLVDYEKIELESTFSFNHPTYIN